MKNEDILTKVFTLPEECARALYSIEYCLTKHNNDKENDPQTQNLMNLWLQKWEESLNKGSENNILITDELALINFLNAIAKKKKNNMYKYLIIVESMFFVPYFPLESEPMKKNTYKLDEEYFKDFILALNIDDSVLSDFKKRFQRAHFWISQKYVDIAVISIVAGIITAITAGVAAPYIAIAFAAEGLYGAAAISSGLAFLGGGAIAAGGFGMVGGITVLVSAGGILGIGAGAGIGAIYSKSPELALLIASKLEVIFYEVVIKKLKDIKLAKMILNRQGEYINSLSTELDEMSGIANQDNNDSIKKLKKVIKYLTIALNRNRDFLHEQLFKE